MRVIMLFLVVLLAGCSDTITDQELQSFYKLCSVNGGVKYVYISGGLKTYVCKNGAEFTRATIHETPPSK